VFCGEQSSEDLEIWGIGSDGLKGAS